MATAAGARACDWTAEGGGVAGDDFDPDEWGADVARTRPDDAVTPVVEAVPIAIDDSVTAEHGIGELIEAARAAAFEAGYAAGFEDGRAKGEVDGDPERTRQHIEAMIDVFRTAHLMWEFGTIVPWAVLEPWLRKRM
jgi:hypothetical protein